ncbi:hypothetical protein J7U46_13915 [Pelomonas sp. V22]|uniref:hypothetical protein n=1 Tax=Pelomonas sp. V22 TaxID=2822139 RepID=UPI0024A7F34A|nr:hypothetical protein [Pelomonas sp. V22]MDI4634149.1 hypothetical protein [Pelomonas sp. V22]
MLLLVFALKLIAEIGLLACLGRGLLGLLIGARREGNFFYGLLDVVARPFDLVAGRRWALLLAAGLWLAVTAWKIQLCLGGAACR